MKMIKNVDFRTPLISPIANKTPVNITSIEAMTPDKEKNVVGTFVNIECPGQPAKICGRYYRGMQYFEKVINDNERVTIPYSVSRYINERCMYEQHHYSLDEQGNPQKVSKTTARYKFIVEQVA